MFEAIGEKILAIFESLITFIYKSFVEPFTGLSSLKDLVYGQNKDDGESLIWSTFHASDLTDAFGPVYIIMLTLAGSFLLHSLLLVA